MWCYAYIFGVCNCWIRVPRPPKPSTQGCLQSSISYRFHAFLDFLKKWPKKTIFQPIIKIEAALARKLKTLKENGWLPPMLDFEVIIIFWNRLKKFCFKKFFSNFSSDNFFQKMTKFINFSKIFEKPYFCQKKRNFAFFLKFRKFNDFYEISLKNPYLHK